MKTWVFEPGHTSAEFVSRHMMVTKIRGLFTGIEGHIEFDPDDLGAGSVEARILTGTLWTGEEARDAHLKSEDFIHAGEYPEMRYRGQVDAALGCNELRVSGQLTLRGVTRDVPLHVRYLGGWDTDYWVDGVNQGPIRRLGFEATTTIDRHDFGVSWNSRMERGGVVVGDDIRITIDVEALESGVIEGI